MRKNFYLSIFTICSVSVASAQFNVINQTEQKLEVNFKLGKMFLNSNSGFTRITDENTSPILEKGSPDLGKYSFSMMLPATGEPSLSVTEGDYVEYEGITILPSKGSLKRNINPSDVALEYGDAYAQNQFYPANRASLNQPFILRNVRGVAVHVFPYAYNPVTKVLRVYKNMRISVTTNQAKSGVNPLTSIQHADGAMQPVYENLFINYERPQLRYTPLQEKGEMLIISQPACVNAVQPLADWKIQKGIKTTVVSTAVTGTTQSAIKTYISNFYTANPNLMFVLFVGDHEQVKAYNAGSTGWETKWSDTYYAFITGTDEYPEVFMGRLPAKNATQCTSMVNKILEYEKTPSSGTWYYNSIGVASNEGDGIGDEGEADWEHMRNLRTELMNFGYTTVHEFYDASHGGADAPGDPTNTMVANAVETGASLFMYCGHGSLGTCVTSNYSISDIQDATNYGKYPFVISVACNNGTFPGGESIMEEFMRASNTSGPTGAIAACGSSILMAWAEPMETEDEITKILTQAYASNLKYTMGGLFYNGQMKMLETYPGGNGEEVMETWVMFGDPSVMMRSKTPQTMVVSAPTCYNAGTEYILNGSLNGADAAVTQSGDILATDVVASGAAGLDIPAGTTGAITLTVTGYNQVPYINTVTSCALSIGEINESSIHVYPNPASSQLFIDNGAGSTYMITDAAGKMIASGVYTNAIDISALSGGMYLLQVKDQQGKTGVSRFIKE